MAVVVAEAVSMAAVEEAVTSAEAGAILISAVAGALPDVRVEGHHAHFLQGRVLAETAALTRDHSA